MPKAAVTAGWLALIGLGAPCLATADCKLTKIAEFHTAPNSSEPVVDATINDTPVKVLIDSSASVSLIPLHKAQQLGLIITESRGMHLYDDIAGESQVYVAHIKLKIGDFEKRDLELIVAGDPHTRSDFSLVLGDDFLSQTDTEFDLPDNAVRLFEPQGCTPPQLVYWGAPYSEAKIAPWDRDNPDIAAEALLNGRKVWAILSSGAPTSWIETATASSVGVRWASSDPTDGPKMHGIGPASQDSRVGLFDSFRLGDERVSNVRLPVTAYAHLEWYSPRMFLGADFFRAHRIYVDVKDHLVLFSYAGGPIFSEDAR